jgi:hypothetical protein
MIPTRRCLDCSHHLRINVRHEVTNTPLLICRLRHRPRHYMPQSFGDRPGWKRRCLDFLPAMPEVSPTLPKGNQ